MICAKAPETSASLCAVLSEFRLPWQCQTSIDVVGTEGCAVASSAEGLGPYGAGFFKELGRAVGDAHNAIDNAIGEAISTAVGLMKNDMYQRSN